jgi:hypothetical protein
MNLVSHGCDHFLIASVLIPALSLARGDLRRSTDATRYQVSVYRPCRSTDQKWFWDRDGRSEDGSEEGAGIEVFLMRGAQEAHEHGLRFGALVGAIAPGGLAVDDRGSDGVPAEQTQCSFSVT